MNNAILLISCNDQKGITAAVTNFVYQNNGNIVSSDQHIDEQSNTFFMRIEWSLDGFNLKSEEIDNIFRPLAEQFKMYYSLFFTGKIQKVAVFVSKHLHCLHDLLLRHSQGELSCEIPLIVSNHPDAKKVADIFGVAFEEFNITAENKAEEEKRQIDLLQNRGIDVVVLARYHQILTLQFIQNFKNRIINIHHSFLPAFAGGNPYAQAYKKGVKIIGATSHYVVEELDAGPIIDQDTVCISHRDALQDLVRKGQDLEKIVLSRAVRWHLQHKILLYDNKTVVFD